jgi:transcriptional regulator of acetoin/glycerol metabolism
VEDKLFVALNIMEQSAGKQAMGTCAALEENRLRTQKEEHFYHYRTCHPEGELLN